MAEGFGESWRQIVRHRDFLKSWLEALGPDSIRRMQAGINAKP